MAPLLAELTARYDTRFIRATRTGAGTLAMARDAGRELAKISGTLVINAPFRTLKLQEETACQPDVGDSSSV